MAASCWRRGSKPGGHSVAAPAAVAHLQDTPAFTTVTTACTRPSGLLLLLEKLGETAPQRSMAAADSERGNGQEHATARYRRSRSLWEADVCPGHELPSSARFVTFAARGGPASLPASRKRRTLQGPCERALRCCHCLPPAADRRRLRARTRCRESCKYCGVWKRRGQAEPLVLATVEGVGEDGRQFSWVARRARKRVRSAGLAVPLATLAAALRPPHCRMPAVVQGLCLHPCAAADLPGFSTCLRVGRCCSRTSARSPSRRCAGWQRLTSACR